MKKIIYTLLMATCLNSAFAAPNKPDAPKNIIMIVGDGMGPAYTSAYRYFKDNPNTPQIEPTVFDNILVGRSSTYPAKVSGVVTDSAASATALATGYKSYNGAIGVDVNEEPQLSVMQYAKSLGKSTGLVVTSQINHATPASYAAHVKQRKMYNEIADQFFDNKIKGEFTVDIMLGGGTKYFKRADRDLTREFTQAGYQYIENYSQLSSLASDKVLGLFAEVGLPWTLDETQPNRLMAMTKAAIDRLDNNKQGFFMLIEGSQIDWAGHSNDIASAMAELDDLAQTIEWLTTYATAHPETLVIITADHSTGGFTIGREKEYAWRPAFIKNLKASPQQIAKLQTGNKLNTQQIQQQLGFNLNADEEKNLLSAHQQGEDALYKAIKKLIDIRTNTGWTTRGHTGIDVPVFAFGPHKDLFKGQIDNTDIAKNIFKLLKQ